jgi:hypothetical protein
LTLHAIRPTAETASVEDAEVIAQLRYGSQFVEQAITAWHLVDKARADELEATKNRASLAAGDGEIRFYPEDLQKLVGLLTGVDAIIAAGIVVP